MYSDGKGPSSPFIVWCSVYECASFVTLSSLTDEGPGLG